MLTVHPANEFFLAHAPFFGRNHDRRAMCIIGTHIYAAVAGELLKSDPNIGLDVLNQMADMNRPIGIRQRGRNENLARHVANRGLNSEEAIVLAGGAW